jgi:6-phosphofructokinase
MRIGILTSGGDAPGLNAVIRGAVLTGMKVHELEFVGFRNGWRGVVEGDIIELGRDEVKGISKQGGTILGTSRTNPFEGEGGVDRVNHVMADNNIDAIIAIGGEGTLAAAKRLTDAGVKIVGVPKTVDNDLDATDYSFGFDTAVQIATDAMDRLRTTGDAHDRCMVAEVMGRHVGWIALHSGMAAGAHVILIPERKTSVRPRLGGIGELLAPIIEHNTGIETRATTLGHIQRGGTPSAFDRVLATRLGMAAMRSVVEGHWGRMVALRGTDIVHVPFAEALGRLKTVPDDRYEEARVLFG